MPLDPANQLKKNRPIILELQSEPDDSVLEPGQFAIFPRTLNGKTELYTKSKDEDGIVTPATNLTKDGGTEGDNNGDFTSYVHTITVGQAAAKKFTLSPTPKAGSVIQLIPLGGPEQVFGEDYELINTNELSWAGLGLDGDLVVTDKVLVKYFS